MKVGDKIKLKENLKVGNDFGAYCSGDMAALAGEVVEVTWVGTKRFKIKNLEDKTFTFDMVDETKYEEAKSEPSKPATPSLTLDLGIDMKDIMANAITNYVTNNQDLVNQQIKKEVKEAVKELKPTLVQIADRPAIEITGKTHKKFKEVLFLANSENQVYIYGPAGSGKTTLCKQVSEALKLPFAHISCSVGMSEAHLLGRMLFNGDYVSSDFVELYENGGVFLFDEIDAADPNTLLVINSALANNRLSVPNRQKKPHAERHKDFICIVAGNTIGQGSVEYSGRNFLDAAFMDRFALSKVVVDYDKELEREICAEHENLYNVLQQIRDNIQKNRLQRVLSTRAFISAVRLVEQGTDINKIKGILTIGWSEEERRKCLGN